MPLTRHLYREDEVAAALMLCVDRGLVQEALFWSLELLDSGLTNQFYGALKTIWILSFSKSAPEWLSAFEEEYGKEMLDSDAMLEFVAGLARSPLPRQGFIARGAAATETAVVNSPSRRALNADMAALVAEWRRATGRPRARRVYKIPVECLYWITARGRELSVYDTTEKEIMGSLEKPGALWGSEYWDEVAVELDEERGWLAVKEDAAVREAFYDTHFPDDIPDEWSKAERAKSHGSGVLQRGAQATGLEWIRRWYGAAQSKNILQSFEKVDSMNSLLSLEEVCATLQIVCAQN
jgi:hypothetical protein